ncbi:valine--tRNA ligase [Parasphingopyxis sp.]|uniref:valine--tRNA ligase n=1 Tax=Parasphingopyxis sp. TaxID=1920299 RepID=UPI00262EF776|nr:valine--tRNA ligase [Parasphingopyxis sp.]
MSELPKTFDPAAIEARWYAHWEENGLFRPERDEAEPFTIVNPPPNVTGKLHIGHALDNTLQDILIRHQRLLGKDALWVVGTDHAGIATQMVVERQLNEKQQKRTDFTREQFVEKVWEWKEESGGTITQQLRRLGCSMDWANERFTMDEGFTKAVTKVFVDLYNDGLIYRDKRLVNWDPGLKTAISDLEVENSEINGHFWHFSYPLEDGSGAISVATTRPETMLADMAVAVHPSDERYADVVGKKVKLPITGRLVPVITDEHADPELGSGAVKITPGHDFNDFDVGKRAGIAPADMLNMLDANAAVCQTADGLIPDELVGMDRFDARKRVVEMIDEAGLLEQVEDRVIVTPYGDRSNVVIEPWLTDQWYVDAETLAQGPIKAVRDGTIKIVPKSWEKTFFNWMENIQPWCVSRQLWWGHRIPVWYGDDGQVYVAADEAEAQAMAGEDVALMQDGDVLDTWFSSGLWPFATLGWPDETDDLKRHYPNSVLISGFDILFFWDARMMMQGMHFMGEVPWHTLYLHGLVRAADGQKMSKSKGNTVDPLGLIDTYGADALRFFMAAMESQGRDIKMDEKRVEGYRNFATKLWNAARFCQANGIGASETLEAPSVQLPINRWIIAEVTKTVRAVDRAFEKLRFDRAASEVYQFVWHTFCDWYLELTKPVSINDRRGQIDSESKTTVGWALDQILVMLHPFMPFVTEELWSKMGDRHHYPLITARWPMERAKEYRDSNAEVRWVIRLVKMIRSVRAELNIPASDRPVLQAFGPADLAKRRLNRFSDTICRMARIDKIRIFDQDEPRPDLTAEFWLDDNEFHIPLEGVIDVPAEKTRLTKSLVAAEKEASKLDKRLSNPQFVEKAKPEAVEKARTDHAEKMAEVERLKAALERLG